jgi:hypothetical protein
VGQAARECHGRKGCRGGADVGIGRTGNALGPQFGLVAVAEASFQRGLFVVRRAQGLLCLLITRAEFSGSSLGSVLGEGRDDVMVRSDSRSHIHA